MIRKLSFPWPEPISHYDSDGPKDGKPLVFEVGGVVYSVSPTFDSGSHTGRNKYLVVCVTCGDVLHKNTTGPRMYIENHHDKHHGEQKR